MIYRSSRRNPADRWCPTIEVGKDGRSTEGMTRSDEKDGMNRGCRWRGKHGRIVIRRRKLLVLSSAKPVPGPVDTLNSTIAVSPPPLPHQKMSIFPVVFCSSHRPTFTLANFLFYFPFYTNSTRVAVPPMIYRRRFRNKISETVDPS